MVRVFSAHSFCVTGDGPVRSPFRRQREVRGERVDGVFGG